MIEALFPAACHVTERYANNCVKADHGCLRARLRPMRGLKRLRSAWAINAGHAFVQNLRRGQAIFTELVRAIDRGSRLDKLICSRPMHQIPIYTCARAVLIRPVTLPLGEA